MSDDEKDPPWKTAAFGVFCFAISGYLYWDLTKLEVEGGTRRVHWLVALLYNIGGKWPPVLLFAIAGLALIAFAVRGLMKKS